MKKKKLFSAVKKITSIMLVVAAMASVLMLSGCGERATIDFKEVISIKKINGVNGEGYAVLNADSDKVLAALGDMNESSARALMNSFDIQPENNGSLSNGGKLVITVNTDTKMLENANVKVTNTHFELDVSGLPTGIKNPEDLEGEVFENLKVLAKETLIKKMPEIENIEFAAAYMFDYDPEKSSFGELYNYDYMEGQFFTILMFSANDPSSENAALYAVRLKTPIIDTDGNVVSEEIKYYGSSETEEKLFSSINEMYTLTYFLHGVKAK